MINVNCEIETKFQVPASSRAAVTAEMSKNPNSFDRITLAAHYLDTADRRLAQAGIAWRLRREGRRWVQTLKVAGVNNLERYEHEVIRPAAIHDSNLHAGTTAGDRLIAILGQAHTDGIGPEVRFRTEVRRLARRIRARGAVIDVAFDEGRIVTGERSQPIREVEFELVSGSATAMLALAERWRKRFDLMLDPRSKADRGDRLADGFEFPPVRRATRARYAKHATPVEAFVAVLDDCLAQITHNAVGICEGDPNERVEYVHQMRVGIRRLRSAVRSFQGWVAVPPQHLIDDLRSLFATLGQSRDTALLDSGVTAALISAGAPPIHARRGGSGLDLAKIVRATNVQRVLLGWVAWRMQIAEMPSLAKAPSGATRADDAISVAQTADQAIASEEPSPVTNGAGLDALSTESSSKPAREAAETELHLISSARKRLRKWHRRVAAEAKNFDSLDDTALHGLRKRIKRQRYAAEFFAPLVRKGRCKDYLKPLAEVQECMGELNDLLVARSRYEALVTKDPAAWFALGWLAARIREVRMGAKRALHHLAGANAP